MTLGPSIYASMTLGPSIYWYVTRAGGAVALILLTASVVIGIAAIAPCSPSIWNATKRLRSNSVTGGTAAAAGAPAT